MQGPTPGKDVDGVADEVERLDGGDGEQEGPPRAVHQRDAQEGDGDAGLDAGHGQHPEEGAEIGVLDGGRDGGGWDGLRREKHAALEEGPVGDGAQEAEEDESVIPAEARNGAEADAEACEQRKEGERQEGDCHGSVDACDVGSAGGNGEEGLRPRFRVVEVHGLRLQHRAATFAGLMLSVVARLVGRSVVDQRHAPRSRPTLGLHTDTYVAF